MKETVEFEFIGRIRSLGQVISQHMELSEKIRRCSFNKDG